MPWDEAQHRQQLFEAEETKQAVREFASWSDTQLLEHIRLLRSDTLAAKTRATLEFTVDRIWLIARVLESRLKGARARARRFELAAMKEEPPEVKVEPDKGVTR